MEYLRTRQRLDFRQRLALVHRDVIGRITVDFVLRLIDTAAVRVTFVLHVFRVHLHDFSLHVARFRIPTYVVSNRKFLGQGDSLRRQRSL